MSVQKHYDMGLEDGAYWEQERIIQRIKEELPKMLRQHGLVIIPEVFDYFIEQIKQDKMSDPSASVSE